MNIFYDAKHQRKSFFSLRTFIRLVFTMSFLAHARGFLVGGKSALVRGSAGTPLFHQHRTLLFSTSTKSDTRLFPEEINVLYDSKCNVCKLEMDWLVSRDIQINGPNNRRLKLTDLEDENGFDATDPCNGGIDYETGMAAIYAIKYDGTVYKGVPVFELAYAQVGLGWIWKINQIPAVNKFLEWGYNIFAKNRTKITRGASLEEIFTLKAAQRKMAEDCETCQTKSIP